MRIKFEIIISVTADDIIAHDARNHHTNRNAIAAAVLETYAKQSDLSRESLLSKWNFNKKTEKGE